MPKFFFIFIAAIIILCQNTHILVIPLTKMGFYTRVSKQWVAEPILASVRTFFRIPVRI